ncbi:MAG: dipeptidase [Bacteroidetes bacterium]|nr:MAG: dipeptidase [Bacteroidota bacterium]
MEKYIEIIEKDKSRHLNELIEFLKFPSISSQSEHKPDMEKCASWLVENLKNSGINNVRIIPTEGHSIIYGEWLGAGKDKPTILIYGHYDIQPVDPIDLWTSNPFEPEIRNGKIWARGTADDKGQLFCHVKAIESHFKANGKLPVNVKILFEGEEEAMESHLDDFIINNSELLSCDTAIISDTEWFAEGLPTICYGLRGISLAEITVTGPNRDVHSGSFGGGIDNPLNVLCWMVAQLRDRYGRIRVPGFYDNIIELTDEEREAFKILPYNEKLYCEDLGIKSVFGETGYSTLERVWARPALDLNGIVGGYTGEGAKTIIPSKASAKISMRLVPNQDPEDIAKKFESYIKLIAPPTIKVEVVAKAGGKPVLTPLNDPAIKAASRALKLAFGKEPVFMREGGSIPVAELFQSILNANTVFMGFGLPTDNIHSPNENYDLNNFYSGIKAIAYFLDESAKK